MAQMTGFPARLHRTDHHLLGKEDLLWVGISMPRSPRATMIPSLASRISSNLTGKLQRQSLYRTRACTVTPSFPGFSNLAILAPGQVPMTSSQGCSSCSQSPKGPTEVLPGGPSAPGEGRHFTEGKGEVGFPKTPWVHFLCICLFP